MPYPANPAHRQKEINAARTAPAAGSSSEIRFRSSVIFRPTAADLRDSKNKNSPGQPAVRPTQANPPPASYTFRVKHPRPIHPTSGPALRQVYRLLIRKSETRPAEHHEASRPVHIPRRRRTIGPQRALQTEH